MAEGERSETGSGPSSWVFKLPQVYLDTTYSRTAGDPAAAKPTAEIYCFHGLDITAHSHNFL